MTRIKSPYIKQLIAFAVLAACIAGINWFDARLTVDMPDPRGFDIYMKVFAVVVLIAAVAIVYVIDKRKLKQRELYPQDFVAADEREEQLIVMHSVFLLSLRAHTGKSASL